METAILASYRNGLPLKFDIEFKPFRLDPTLPVDTVVNKAQLYAHKFGAERSAKIQSLLNERGERFGIVFNFDGPIRQSADSQRLIRYAFEKQRELQIGECVPMTPCIKNDLQSKLANMLFRAFFENGEDIGDYGVLAKYSEAVGLMSYDETIDFLKSPAYRDRVEDMIEEAQDQGITGVPYTVINNKWAIAGGQTAETYYNIFERMALTYQK